MEKRFLRSLDVYSKYFRHYLLYFYIAVSLVGCPDQSTDDAVITVDHYCEDLANVFCSAVVPCCSDIEGAMNSESCIEMVEAKCADVESYSDSYNSRLAVGCLDAIDTYLYSGCKVPEDRSFDSAGCTAVFSGEVLIDGECQSSYQCADSSKGDSICEQDVCKVIDWAKENEPCGEAHPSCESGLYCDIESGNCTADQPTLGEPECLHLSDGNVEGLFK